MKFRRFALAILLAALSLPAAAAIPSPSQHLGFEVGADRQLADYRQIGSYFRMLDAQSPRVEVISLGKTTLGEEMLMAVISSESNIANLSRIREIARGLADPRGLSDAEVEALIDEGKAVVLVTCNIHSTEIASSQMAMEWAWALASAEDEETKSRLENVVLLLVPSLNPDGQIMETEWYRKWLGTRYEGGRLPWLYHHYVGHDNNRDWFMLTQLETRHLTRALYHEWFPQVFVDEHQMGANGPRMFIPPFADPVDPDIHPLIWREINLIGSNMAFRLEQAEKSGVIYGYGFDAYWIGGTRNTGWWKNITGLLLEVASARIASPVEIHASELQGGRKGLIEYKPQVNHPNPWPGGIWTMRDIMDYERIASDALLEIVSERREDFLRNIAVRARDTVALATPREAYRIPALQQDYATARRLAHLLADHGVEVIGAKNGDYWIPLAQPYARFAREMLEPQRYPEIRPVEGGGILRPYDVASWTLPAMMGVVVEKGRMPAFVEGTELVAPITLGERLPAAEPTALTDAPWFAVMPRSAENAKVINVALRGGSVFVSTQAAHDLAQAPVPVEFPAGTFWLDRNAALAAAPLAARLGVDLVGATGKPLDAVQQKRPRVAIYKPWVASMDEGWTRWLLDEYGFQPETLDNATIRRAAPTNGKLLLDRFDTIILPDVHPSIIATGKRPGSVYQQALPPGYEGGLEKEGVTALGGFVDGGGLIIGLDSASEYLIEALGLPVRNTLAGARSADFDNPGSLFRAHVERNHPLTVGLPSELAIFHDDAIAFETIPASMDIRRSILLTYPEESRDILLSGWTHGVDRLERKAAAVAISRGKGNVVLFGFRPQHRGQTHGTFPLLFNALWWSTRSAR
ncbi:MAG TPA: M14 metallopeptidase family protein [Thermoanaerobaculia bacterium]|nr:M14 metallopeptidase family protein [Thermoanaerobaculia bacterium]